MSISSARELDTEQTWEYLVPDHFTARERELVSRAVARSLGDTAGRLTDELRKKFANIIATKAINSLLEAEQIAARIAA